MYRLVVLTVLIILLASCEKDLVSQQKTTAPENANLTVSIYSIEHTPFESLTRVAASQACNHLNFMVYDMEGARVKQTNQMLGDADFGKASFQLAEGSYQLVAVAHSSNGNPTATDIKKIRFSNSQGYSDTFLQYLPVTVTSQSQSLQLSLERIVSLCRFILTDDYPQNVKQMRFQYTGGSGGFDAATGYGSINSTQTLFFDVAAGQKQFDLYTFLHADEGTIHLTATAYDASDNVLHEREFDIPLRRNEVTRVSGPFFSGSGSTNFNIINVSSVDINTTWGGQTTINY